jgi:hypothetical protein
MQSAAIMAIRLATSFSIFHCLPLLLPAKRELLHPQRSSFSKLEGSDSLLAFIRAIVGKL